MPDFTFKGKASSLEVGNLVETFDKSGIIDAPPKNVKQIVATSNIIFCSDLARSIESANSLAESDSRNSNIVFREVELPYFNNSSIKLPVKLWLVLLRCLSIFGFSANGESLSIARKRAKLAASVLIEAAQSNESALLVGHGFINRLIAKELLANNWVGPSKPSSNYWGYGVYTYNAT